MAKKKEGEKNRCRDCIHARDYHERNYKGEFFLCKCDYQSRSMFLNIDCCNNFKLRKKMNNL